MYRLLIADDDPNMLDMIESLLEDAGYSVSKASSSSEVMNMLEKGSFDLFLIDLTLSERGTHDGLQLCQQLRKHPEASDKPILFLTGNQDVKTAAKALEVGGDDYIRKPFAVPELMARIRAHLRRAKLNSAESVMLRINPDAYTVDVNGETINLTRIEFDLLYFMVHSPKQWLSTRDLLAGVWNYPDGSGDAALVRNHIRNLRRKIESDPERPAIIQSRHRRGYGIFVDVEMVYANVL